MSVSSAAVTPWALAALLLPCLPTHASGLPPDLQVALKNFDRAHSDGDVSLLDRLTSEDYRVLNSNISLENKREFLADFKLPGFKIDPYEREQVNNRAWSEAAVTAGVVLLGWTQDGVHHLRRLRYIDVWRKHSGQWQVTFTQVTRAPD